MGNLKKVSFKYLSNNWIVTLTATLIGVFAALYLNEVVETKKLNNKKSIATKNIFLEVEANQESLEKSIKKLEMTLKTIAFLKPRMKSKKIKNLYYAGQLTTPGPGVPPSIVSGEVVARLISRESK
jgi:uncharacterized membrane protein (DUF106 family)